MFIYILEMYNFIKCNNYIINKNPKCTQIYIYYYIFYYEKMLFICM